MRIAWKKRVALVAVTAAFVASGGLVQAMPSESRANWTGTLTSDKGNAMFVVATFDPGELLLHFSEPGACTIAAGTLKAAEGERIYRFKVSNNGGPFCARLYPGDLTLTDGAGDTFHMRFRRGEVLWAGQLELVGDR
jgi:hypothetical protein